MAYKPKKVKKPVPPPKRKKKKKEKEIEVVNYLNMGDNGGIL